MQRLVKKTIKVQDYVRLAPQGGSLDASMHPHYPEGREPTFMGAPACPWPMLQGYYTYNVPSNLEFSSSTGNKARELHVGPPSKQLCRCCLEVVLLF